MRAVSAPIAHRVTAPIAGLKPASIMIRLASVSSANMRAPNALNATAPESPIRRQRPASRAIGPTTCTKAQMGLHAPIATHRRTGRPSASIIPKPDLPCSAPTRRHSVQVATPAPQANGNLPARVSAAIPPTTGMTGFWGRYARRAMRKRPGQRFALITTGTLILRLPAPTRRRLAQVATRFPSTRKRRRSHASVAIEQTILTKDSSATDAPSATTSRAGRKT